MSLHKYLTTINSINPYKIYVENVRSFFNTNKFMARLMLEMAVVDKILEKKVGVICPNDDCGRIISSYNSFNEIPDEISCEVCELGEKEHFNFSKDKIKTIEFYQIKK